MYANDGRFKCDAKVAGVVNCSYWRAPEHQEAAKSKGIAMTTNRHSGSTNQWWSSPGSIFLQSCSHFRYIQSVVFYYCFHLWVYWWIWVHTYTELYFCDSDTRFSLFFEISVRRPKLGGKQQQIELFSHFGFASSIDIVCGPCREDSCMHSTCGGTVGCL